MLLALLLAAATAPAAGAPPPCHLIFPVAPDAAAARRIAEAVLETRGRRNGPRYVLKVRRDREDARYWTAFQDLPPPRAKLRPGYVLVRAGGGGLGMRIDRCTGEVSELFYQR